jgi:hypothetical protein
VTYILQTFIEGFNSGPADIMFIFNFSLKFKKFEGSCSHCLSYPPSKFRQMVAKGGTYTASLMYSEKEKSMGSELRGTRAK